jgi:hypothetical protein
MNDDVASVTVIDRDRPGHRRGRGDHPGRKNPRDVRWAPVGPVADVPGGACGRQSRLRQQPRRRHADHARRHGLTAPERLRSTYMPRTASIRMVTSRTASRCAGASSMIAFVAARPCGPGSMRSGTRTDASPVPGRGKAHGAKGGQHVAAPCGPSPRWSSAIGERWDGLPRPVTVPRSRPDGASRPPRQETTDGHRRAGSAVPPGAATAPGSGQDSAGA